MLMGGGSEGGGRDGREKGRSEKDKDQGREVVFTFLGAPATGETGDCGHLEGTVHTSMSDKRI